MRGPGRCSRQDRTASAANSTDAVAHTTPSATRNHTESAPGRQLPAAQSGRGIGAHRRPDPAGRHRSAGSRSSATDPSPATSSTTRIIVDIPFVGIVARPEGITAPRSVMITPPDWAVINTACFSSPGCSGTRP